MAEYQQLKIMLPAFARPDLGDDVIADTVVGCDDPIAAWVAPNCPHLIGGQFPPVPCWWTFDVTPRLSGKDHLDIGLSNAVLPSEFDLGQRTGTNGKHIGFSKLRAALSFTYRRVASVPGNLVRHVRVVVAEHKMRRVAAGRVIASVQDEALPIPVWMRQEIGNPVGLIMPTLERDPAISPSTVGAFGPKSCPFPALIRSAYLNAHPKGFWRIGSHGAVIAQGSW